MNVYKEAWHKLSEELRKRGDIGLLELMARLLDAAYDNRGFPG